MSEYYSAALNESTDRLDYIWNHPKSVALRARVGTSGYRNLSTLLVADSMEYGVSESGHEAGAVPFVNIENIDESGRIDPSEMKYVASVRDDRRLRAGDVLISRSRSVGLSAVTGEEQEGWTFGSYIIRFRLDPSLALPLFVAKFINSETGRKQVEILQTGSSGSNINTGQIKRIRIPVIPLDEQGRVLQEISIIERAAESAAQAAEEGRVIASQAIMAHLKIRPKRPVPTYYFRTGKADTSLFFSIPFAEATATGRLDMFSHRPDLEFFDRFLRSYVTVPLKDACERFNRGDQPEYDPLGEVLAIRTSNLRNGGISYDECLRVSKGFYDTRQSARIELGDVLVSSTGYVSMGKVDLMDRDVPSMADGHLTILKLRREFDPRFIIYFLRSDLGKAQFERGWSGSSGQIEITPECLGAFRVPSPKADGVPPTQQKQIADDVEKSWKRVEELDAKVVKLRHDARKTFEGRVSVRGGPATRFVNRS